MKIEEISIEKIIPYGLNNRVHSEEQIERIAKSISEFGFNQPIVVDEDNVILVGHGRYEAAKKLKLKEVPVLKVLGLDETKKRAYRILDNKLQNDSTWDFENLESEIEFLKDQDFDIEGWGLDSFDVKDIIPEEYDESITDNVTIEKGYKFIVQESEIERLEKALIDLQLDFPGSKIKKM